MKWKAVVLDLDGTLLNSKKQVSARNMKAVLACHCQGMKIIFATARPPRTVNAFLPKELLEIGAFVYYNGAEVICKKTGYQFSSYIPAYLTFEIVEFCLHQEPDAHVTMEVSDQWFSYKEYDAMTMMKVKLNPLIQPLPEFKKNNATKILLSGSSPELKRALMDTFGDKVHLLVTDQNELIQIMPLHTSKERAVCELCLTYGIPMESVMVFGDDMNDLGLFQEADYSVAMGNAVAVLKQIADETTDNNDLDGVALVLEKYVGQFSYGCN
ncbi:Cof-type HAD-IIB family hydrolase [Paenibacillus sp. Marseille-Q4541]|uniref:Cof-type HAD-IIB family hydrolase n=1 Tax=Paenibacillus sp. Marseille-Q4541 TaxID=2831522 RepID=UPI001BAD0A52|nr:Cof-type HAD-IIB family hydrolase [Paenibacillus sp. Marseille-Q4541]